MTPLIDKMPRTFKDKVALTLENEVFQEPLNFIQCKQISILNCIFIASALEGQVAIMLNACDDVIIRDCKFSDNQPIYAFKSKNITVAKNDAFDITCAKPRGQFFQANQCLGPITIANNTISNTGKNVIVEDFINLYKTQGTKESPCLITANTIYGNHGTSKTGGGIMLGDNGGSWQIARDNLLVNPGQYGIGVAGGAQITVENNRVFGEKSSISNVGIYVWSQKTAPLYDIRVVGNKVDYTNKIGKKNPFWLGDGADKVTSVEGNDFEWDFKDAQDTLPEAKDENKVVEKIQVVVEKKAKCYYESGLCVRIDLI